MIDIQAQGDERGIDIDQVGVTGLTWPVVVLDQRRERQHTVASVSMSVDVPSHFKGTHMSRFLEVLDAHRGEFTMRTLPAILQELKQRLVARSARVELTFPYFLERQAPVSGASALMDYECTFVGEANGGTTDFLLGVKVPVTTLCPCSKAISDYGAHNQRGIIEMQIRTHSEQFVWIEELVDVAEQSGSAPVYGLLKRPDERHVTMQAYDNPRFVEDVVREVALRLQEDDRVTWFRVRVDNEESIHNHSAFACLEWRRPG